MTRQRFSTGLLAALRSELFLTLALSVIGVSQAGADGAQSPGSVQDSVRTFDNLPIRKITIVRKPVFGDANDGSGNFLNRVHATTSEKVIMRELLFEKGDLLNNETIRETERNLRATGLFQNADLAVSGNSPDSVDILVTTRDMWTLYPSIIPQGGGGLSSIDFAFADVNFRGRRQVAAAAVKLATEGNKTELYFSEPRLFGSRFAVEQDVVLKTEPGWKRNGSRFFAEFSRPLYSRRARWGFSLWFDHDDGVYKEFEGSHVDTAFYDVPTGTVYEWKYDFTKIASGVSLTRSYGFKFKKNISISARAWDEKYMPVTGLPDSVMYVFRQDILPADEKRRVVEATIKLSRIEYVKEMNFNSFGQTEDIPAGNSASFNIGRSDKAFGSDSSYTAFSASAKSLVPVRSSRYLSLALSAQTSVASGGLINTVLELRAGCYLRKLLGQTAAFSFWYKNGQRLYGTEYFRMGGDTGLRGYQSGHRRGTKLVLGNFEIRTPPRKFGVWRMGGVAFFDTGYAWRRKGELSASRLDNDIGLGMRLNSPELGIPLFRFDFGVPLKASEGINVAFGFGQLF